MIPHFVSRHETPPPNPLPEAERGRRRDVVLLAPPLLAGEGVGGGVLRTVDTAPMFKISAFADEIDPDPQRQIDVLNQCGIRHIELRSIMKTNVLDLTDLQVQELKSLLDRHGITLSAIGSPIGKIKIDDPFPPHLQRFRRALELCKVFGTPNMRVFSYYLTEHGEWDDW